MSKDIIYREDAIKELKECIIADHEAISEYPDDILKYNSGLLTAIQAVYDLPSADRPQGEWTQNVFRSDTYKYECSNCKAHHRVRYDYCPSCGCRMKGADDE